MVSRVEMSRDAVATVPDPVEVEAIAEPPRVAARLNVVPEALTT